MGLNTILSLLNLGCILLKLFLKNSISESIALLTHLRRNGTPPLFDVLSFEINNENYFLLIGIICTTVTFRIAQLVEG